MLQKISFLIIISFPVGCSVLRPEYQPKPVQGVQMNCFQESDPIPWSYCLNKVPGSQNRDILYYFHGRKGDATRWNDKDYHGKLYKLWKNSGASPPLVISISFGRTWFLVDNPDKTGGGLYHIFHDVVIPKIESKLLEPIGKRMIAGISMGGLNTLVASLKRKNFYSKAAAICVPLPTVSPYDKFSKLWNYFQKSSMSFVKGLLIWWFTKEFSPTKQIWDSNYPLALSKNLDPDYELSLYLTCGKNDDWGCMKGSEALVENLKHTKVQVEWVPLPGGHCDTDYPSLGRFLTGTLEKD